MYFKNKTTGITWHITNKDHRSRLEDDTGYEIVFDTNTKVIQSKAHDTSVNDANDNKVDYAAMEWQELRKLATEKGINTHGKKRKQIEQEMGGVNASN